MDANNVEWYIEGEDSGYPAGDFGDALFNGLLETTSIKRLRALIALYLRADSDNAFFLEEGLPFGTREIVSACYHGNNNELEALEKLRHTLAVLPSLLVMTFPQLRRALLEYAQRDNK